MSWNQILRHRHRLGGIKESTLTVYLSCGQLFEDWLKSKHKVTLDDVISGNSQKVTELIDTYVNGYLRGAEVGYRRSVLKHLSAIFRLCGRPLLSRPSVVERGSEGGFLWRPWFALNRRSKFPRISLI